MTNKVQHGQFYTLRSPFQHPLFEEWWQTIEDPTTASFWEPFGGSNNLIKLVLEAHPEVKASQWRSTDIEPEAIATNQVPEVLLEQRDSLTNPLEAGVIITNPPYLAKNSAKRMGITAAFGQWQDLWEASVAMMLAQAGHVAAIIPESFITRSLFRERLLGVISITSTLFDDTGFPVCLALWVPTPQEDFTLYSGGRHLGTYGSILAGTSLLNCAVHPELKVRFNVPGQLLGFKAIDTPKEASIHFFPGVDLADGLVKSTSRALTKVEVKTREGQELLTPELLDQFIAEANRLITTYREESHDVLLTSFKSLRADGVYRRRMDWTTATLIISEALVKMGALAPVVKE